MLLGRIEPDLSEGIKHKPPLASEPLRAALYSGNTILGDIGKMGECLGIMLPRLASCKISSRLDWGVIAIASQFAQLLGSRYMVKYIAWSASVNAAYAEETYEKISCLLARMPGGDVKLHTVLPYLNKEESLSYHTAIRLGVEAYWRGEKAILDAAIERASQPPPDEAQNGLGNPVMELLLLKACRERLESGTVNLADVFSHMTKLSAAERRVYELDAMHLFLTDSDPATIGMMVQGFGLLRGLDQPNAAS